MANDTYEGISHVVKVSTDVIKGCEECSAVFGSTSDIIADSINHYIDEHGYKLLHVGQETTDDHAGKPWHTTVAVLGKHGWSVA